MSAYERRIAPFPVTGPDGALYDHPFLGGLDVPRPQFVDIDADGDLDLFLQERTNELMFFENTGSATAGTLVWRTDRYQDLPIGEWSRFFDFDDDGDLDLLAEERFSYVRYFRNDGTAHSPSFTPVPDSVRAPDGTPIFSDRQNIPNVVDLDCNAQPDLFLGRVDGTVRRYEQASSDPPTFSLLAERFEDIEIVAQIGSRHGANAMAFADFEGDGDLDLFWGDFFEPSVLLIENTGTCEAPVMRSEPIPVPVRDSLTTSGYNVPVFADWDGDTDLDLFVGVLGGAFNPNRTVADNLYFFERVDGELVLETRRFLHGIDVGSESIVTPVDWEGDGDIDLIVSNKLEPTAQDRSRLYRFENVGTARSPAFAFREVMDFGPYYHLAPEFADIDADGDLDLLTGTWRHGVILHENRGTRAQPDYARSDTTWVALSRGSNSTPELVDLDGDGDLDLFVGESSGEINFYRNVGEPSRPRFELVTDTFEDIDVGRRSFPVFIDIDGDGDADMLVGTEADGIVLYRNQGDRFAPRFVLDENFTHPALAPFATPRLVDLDADGRYELLTGGLGGGVSYYEVADGSS